MLDAIIYIVSFPALVICVATAVKAVLDKQWVFASICVIGACGWLNVVVVGSLARLCI